MAETGEIKGVALAEKPDDDTYDYTKYERLQKMGEILSGYVSKSRTLDQMNIVTEFIDNALPVAAVHALKETYALEDQEEALKVTKSLQNILHESLNIHRMRLAKDSLFDVQVEPGQMEEALLLLSDAQESDFLTVLTDFSDVQSEQDLTDLKSAGTRILDSFYIANPTRRKDYIILAHTLLSYAQDARVNLDEKTTAAEVAKLEKPGQEMSERAKDLLFKSALAESIKYLRYCSKSVRPTKYMTDALVWLGMTARDWKLLRSGRAVAEQFWDRLVGREGNVADARLVSEASNFPIFMETQQKEKFKQKSPTQLFAGHLHATVRNQLELLREQYSDEIEQIQSTVPTNGELRGKNRNLALRDAMAAGATEKFKKDSDFAVTCLFDESYRADTRFDMLTLLALPATEVDGYIQANISSMMQKNGALSSSRQDQISLNQQQYDSIRTVAYKATDREKDSDYASFYNKKPDAIINFYTSKKFSQSQYFSTPFTNCNGAEQNVSIYASTGEIAVKSRHIDFDGIPAFRSSVRIAAQGVDYAELYDQKINVIRTNGEKRERVNNFIAPSLEYVDVITLNDKLPKITYVDGGGTEHKRSPSFVISAAIALSAGESFPHYHMLYDSGRTSRNPRIGNVQPSLFTLDAYRENTINRNAFDRFNRMTSNEIERSKRGLSSAACMKAPLGDSTDTMAGLAQAMDPDLGPLRNTPVMVSPAPLLPKAIDSAYSADLAKVKIKGFVTARALSHTNPGDTKPRGGVFGYTSTPAESAEKPEHIISVKVEIGDLSDVVDKIAEELSPNKSSENSYRKIMRQIAKSWQELSMGKISLLDYQQSFKKSYDALTQIGGVSPYYVRRSDTEITDAASFQHELNLAILRDGAMSRLTGKKTDISKNIQRIAAVYGQYGAQIQY